MALFTSKPLNLVMNGALVTVQIAPPEALGSDAPPLDTVAIVNTATICTQIKEGLATSLGLEPKCMAKILTVTRLLYECPAYRIRLRFPDAGWLEVDAVEVPYMQYPNSRVRCVIGRDVLQHCLMIFNGRTNTFVLGFDAGE